MQASGADMESDKVQILLQSRDLANDFDALLFQPLMHGQNHSYLETATETFLKAAHAEIYQGIAKNDLPALTPVTCPVACKIMDLIVNPDRAFSDAALRVLEKLKQSLWSVLHEAAEDDTEPLSSRLHCLQQYAIRGSLDLLRAVEQQRIERRAHAAKLEQLNRARIPFTLDQMQKAVPEHKINVVITATALRQLSKKALEKTRSQTLMQLEQDYEQEWPSSFRGSRQPPFGLFDDCSVVADVHPCLAKFPWRQKGIQVLLGGSAALHCYTQSGFNDYDFYFVQQGTTSPGDLAKALGSCILHLMNAVVAQHKYVVKNPRTVSLVMKNPQMHFQFVPTLFPSVDQKLVVSDMACTEIAFDGSDFFLSPRSILALSTGTIDAQTPYQAKWQNFTNFPERLAKYAARGFGIVWQRSPATCPGGVAANAASRSRESAVSACSAEKAKQEPTKRSSKHVDDNPWEQGQLQGWKLLRVLLHAPDQMKPPPVNRLHFVSRDWLSSPCQSFAAASSHGRLPRNALTGSGAAPESDSDELEVDIVLTINATPCEADPEQMEVTCLTMSGEELVRLERMPGDNTLTMAMGSVKSSNRLVAWLRDRGCRVTRKMPKFALPDGRPCTPSLASHELQVVFGLQLPPWMNEEILFEPNEDLDALPCPVGIYCKDRTYVEGSLRVVQWDVFWHADWKQFCAADAKYYPVTQFATVGRSMEEQEASWYQMWDQQHATAMRMEQKLCLMGIPLDIVQRALLKCMWRNIDSAFEAASALQHEDVDMLASRLTESPAPEDVDLPSIEEADQKAVALNAPLSEALLQVRPFLARLPIVLVEFSRNPRSFNEALENGAELGAVREALQRNGFACTLPCGAHIFVRPEHYQTILGEMQSKTDLTLTRRHVLVAPEFYKFLGKAVSNLRSNEQVRYKKRTVEWTGCAVQDSESVAAEKGSSSEDEDAFYVQRKTFIDFDIPTSLYSSLTSGPKTV